MLTIRLSRGGAKKRPFYNLIVTDSRNSRDGRFIERVGFFNPIARGGEERLRINTDRVNHWIETGGAVISDRVATLIREHAMGPEAVAAATEAKKAKLDAKKAAKKAAEASQAEENSAE